MLWNTKPQFKTGVLEDPRTEEERKQDYLASEVMIKSPIVMYKNYNDWLQTNAANWMKILPIHDQNGSSSCVSQACAMVATILNALEEGTVIPFSARWIYAKRMNRPIEGMFLNDAAQLLIDNGTLMDILVPGNNKTEQQMNELSEYNIDSFKTIAKLYAPSAYFWVDNDIDSFAQILAKGTPMLMAVRFGNNEWNKDIPTINDSEPKYAHAITALPHSYFSYNGKPAIMIADSWGINNGMKGYRIVTKDWFDQGRVFAGIWFVDLKNPTVSPVTAFKFEKDLGYGSIGEDVRKLQEVLKNKYQLFKLELTGNYYGYTMACVKELQKLKGIEQTGYFGPLTRAAVNKDLKA